MKKAKTIQASYEWRFRIVLAGFVVLALAIACRSVFLHVINQDFLIHEGDMRTLRVQEITAHRGIIKDRRQKPLAVSSPVASVWIKPKDMMENRRHWEQLAKLCNLPYKHLKDIVLGNQNKSFVYLKRHISPQQAEKIKDLDHLPAVFQKVVERCGAQGHRPQEKAELHGRGHGHPHEKRTEDGGQAPAHPRPHGQTLGKTDEKGHRDADILYASSLVNIDGPVAAQEGKPENHQSAHHPADDHRVGAEQSVLDLVLQGKTDHHGRQKGENKVGQEFAAGSIPFENALVKRDEPVQANHQNGQNSAELNDHNIGVDGRIRCAVATQPHHLLGHQEMSGGAYGQVFGQSLDNPQHDGLVIVQTASHGRRIGNSSPCRSYHQHHQAR